MKIEKCQKESFVVIGKEGATTDGPVLFKSYGTMQIPILEKFSIWQRKMKMEISVEYGARCLISPGHSSLGKISVKGFILRE